MKEDYNKYSTDELLKMYNESIHLSQVYNLSQLVKKVLLNSLYGALGNNHFLLYTHEMARGITLMGQCLIKKAALAKNRYISKILKEKIPKDRLIYSDTDSCTGDTKIYINNNITTIEDFYIKSSGKELQDNDKFIKKVDDNYYTLSYNNNNIINTKIKYVMKHNIKKHLWKIIVDNKHIIITEDHSIMFIRNGKLLKGSVQDLKHDDVLITINNTI